MKPLFFSTKAVPSALALAAVTTAIFGCATAEPSRELVDARRAYAAAEASPAAQLQPAELLTAHQALTQAEQAFKDDPGSDTETHLAYLAERKSQLAVADAEIASAKAAEDKAEVEYREHLERGASGNQAELDRAKQELASEREARIAAEARASDALKSLEQIATVNETQRGTVITLSGAVLFTSGNEKLSPQARQSLDQVATVLSNQPHEKLLSVEGHTDSRGKDSYNTNLSLRRADAVRTYLVSRGVPAAQIKAVGLGEADPIASNDTPDGRASNRRVEIVIGKSAAKPPSPPAP